MDVPIEFVPFTFDIAKSAFLRVVDGTPPSYPKDQQLGHIRYVITKCYKKLNLIPLEAGGKRKLGKFFQLFDEKFYGLAQYCHLPVIGIRHHFQP